MNQRALLSMILLCAALLGCGGKRDAGHEPFLARDISSASYGKDFSLTDHLGQSRRLADFRGKVVVLFFGYTHCPDVCPTTLADMALALRQLGADAQNVQVLFATVDPERDTQAVLAQYVPSFNPSFLGLRGDAAVTAATAKEFRVFYQKRQTGSEAGYTMDHTAGTYVFDRSGRLRLFLGYGQGADAVAHDLKVLLRENP
ncbi:MAG: SCO family protein [Pseudomonadota bacterium]|jgi:protein SCO1/2